MVAALLRGLGAGLLASVLAFATALLTAPGSAEASEPWQGTVLAAEANVRSSPHSTAPRVAVLPQGAPVTVVGWVTGEEVDPTNNTWAQLGDGQYVYSAVIRRKNPEGPPPPPQGAGFTGKWIDVNVTQQLLTAYEGTNAVRVIVVSSGRPDYPSPEGSFRILRRVYNETMTSASVPWVRDSYSLKNVLFTQYFTDMGAALHLAYWKSEESFGIPTSHGCVGMPYKEAEWVWNWAEVGVPVYVHR